MNASKTKELISKPAKNLPEFDARIAKLTPPYFAFKPVSLDLVSNLLEPPQFPKFVSFCAPVGYGKTVTLSVLHENLSDRGVDVVWITLDDRDNLLASIVNALSQAVHSSRGSSEPAQDWTGNPVNRQDLQIDYLVSELRKKDRFTAIFIDNLNYCKDKNLRNFLERLVFETGPLVSIVLSSTNSIPMDMLKVKIELGGLEFGIESLSFNEKMIESFFSFNNASFDSACHAQQIYSLTEGWPAAIRLLSIHIANEGDIQEAIRIFSGDRRNITRALTRMVIQDLEPEMVDFLVEISLFREFSITMVSQVVGDKRAVKWIEELIGRNFLIFPINKEQKWFRFHTLMRQHLLSESYTTVSRERKKTLLESAANWHADNGDYSSAVELALEAPSLSLAMKWVDVVATSVVADQGGLTVFIDWVEKLLSLGASISLNVHAWYVWCLCFTLQYEKAQQFIESFDDRLSKENLSKVDKELFQKRLGTLRVVSSIYLDSLNLAIEESAKLLEKPANLDPLSTATIATGSAIAYLANGEFIDARQRMNIAAGAIARADSAYGDAWVAIISACLELANGNPVSADRILGDIRPSLVSRIGNEAGVMATLDFVHARALVDLGEEDLAADALARSLQFASRHGVIETTITGLSACLSLWDGDPKSPWSPDSLLPIIRSYGPRLNRLFSVLQVRKLLLLERVVEAKEIIRRERLFIEGKHENKNDSIEQSEFALARLELLKNTIQYKKALEKIEQRSKIATRNAMSKERVELQLLEMTLHLQNGADKLAMRNLGQAIRYSAKGNLYWPFYERLPEIKTLLSKFTTKEFSFIQHEEHFFLSKLQSLTGVVEAGGPAIAATAGASLVSLSLTPRELELLKLLASGINNQQIADQVGLSVPTVKWHLYNLYDKFNVKSRAAVVAKAQTFGIL